MDSEIQTYEFGPYRIDTGERLLHRGDELISLPPKVVETLLALVGNSGRMVDKAELLSRLWPDTFVEEGALTRNISLLRKTLEDTAGETRYIETIPKRGYRFVATVRTVLPEPAAEPAAAGPIETPEQVPKKRRWAVWMAVPAIAGALALAGYLSRPHHPADLLPVVSASTRTLAVLPFRNVIRDPSQDYFVDGMTEALVTSLAKLGNLRVISLASGNANRGESAALGALAHDHPANLVLKGTVLRSGERVRIDAQLLDPKTRSVFWANYYEGDTKDTVALESTVAEAIAREIQGSITAEERKLLRSRPQIPPDALEAYMRGRYFWNRRTEDGLRRAARYFQQAISADPTYALAYSGLADSYSLLGSIGVDGMPPNKAMPLAKAAAQKAIEINPDLAEGHVSLAYVKLSYDWDLPGAAAEFTRAMALNPGWATAHHWRSHYFMAAGELGRATEEMRTAQRLEPLSPAINIGVGWCYYYTREFDQAIEQYRAVLEMEPNFALAHQTIGMAYEAKGMYSEAIEHFKLAATLSTDSPSAVSALGSVYATVGRTREARMELARLEEIARRRYVPALYMAAIHDGLGETAATFEWAWKALGEHSDYLMYLHLEPRAGKVSKHPEFLRLLARVHP
ncbi:MAG TPA: winged helix-turn-helix domain-containing protein [Bryobacteraceae bacterium]|nr:winged helix-turn-helix domain-containing protein [Bryobacteraceae bacterium]